MGKKGDFIGIGLIGLGTIGNCVAKVLVEEEERISRAAGINYKLLAIGVRSLDDKRKPRPGFAKKLLTTDIMGSIVRNQDIEVIIELTGPDKVIVDYLSESLRLGKHVVTANKTILAHHGTELFEIASVPGSQIRFEASVAGAIPVIRMIREALAGDEIQEVYGIINGTCNYILTEMDGGSSYEDALNKAKGKGIAEADPRADIDGFDAQQKAIILASLLCGVQVSEESVYREGIRKIAQEDISFVRKHSYVIKLIATIKRGDSWIDIRVHPVLLPEKHPLASIRGSFNAVYIIGRLSGSTMYYGAGAGGDETASACLGDLIDILRDIRQGNNKIPITPWVKTHSPLLTFRGINDTEFGYYLRLAIPHPDTKNSFTAVIRVLNDHGCLPHIMEMEDKPIEWGFRSVFFMIPPIQLVKEETLRSALREMEESIDVKIESWIRQDPDIKIPI